eukprot:COSAG05_NODE_8125_length_734_cov_0.976378_1_plen_156_part_10
MVIPFRIGFLVELCPTDSSFWIEVLVDCFFALDILVSFRTGTVLGEMVNPSPKTAAMNYLRGWFLIDLLSVLPFGYIAIIVTGNCVNSGNVGGVNVKARPFYRYKSPRAQCMGTSLWIDCWFVWILQVLKVVRITRLLKLLRLSRIRRLFLTLRNY